MGDISGVWILVPAYKPDENMVTLLAALRARGAAPERLVVVDDGGGPGYAQLFDRARDMGAAVLAHQVNRGKGAAIKTGLHYILDRGPGPVVTCDADGQHAPDDIVAIARAALHSPDALVLGVRDKKQMPPKSKAGNNLTCFFLGMTSGLWITDTQTGLRALPAGSLETYAQLAGDRYEYETAVLIAARRARTPVVQVVIHTLYFDKNAGSHFRPFRDGLLIYQLMFGQAGRYVGSSALAGLIDLTLFMLLCYLLPDQFEYLHLSDSGLGQVIGFLLPQVVGVPALAARAVSTLVNYFVNKDVVFKGHAGKRSIVYYYLLAGFVLLVGIQIMKGLTNLGVPVVPAKVVADGIMFVFSYNAQKCIVFRDRSKQV